MAALIGVDDAIDYKEVGIEVSSHSSGPFSSDIKQEVEVHDVDPRSCWSIEGQEEDDTCEQSPKHAPTDRVDILYQLAGGRNGLESGMQTGMDALAHLMWNDLTGNW